MTNREKYKDEIINFIDDGSGKFCREFVEPNILKSLELKCYDTNCTRCQLLQTLWLEEEYKEPEPEPEPEVDWSKVEVDTPVMVTDCRLNKIRHFAKYEDGKVYCWDDGATSLTHDHIVYWENARLLTEEENEERRRVAQKLCGR